MSDVLRHFLPEGASRLDCFLVGCYPDPGRSSWRTWIRSGQVKVDGKVVIKAGARIRSGASVETCMPLPAHAPFSFDSEEIALPTIFEDQYLWIVDKPAGMVVHPSPGHPSGTALNALIGRLGIEAVTKPDLESDCGEPDNLLWPGLVHRLDRYTTGCLAMAKDTDSQRDLQSQFKNRTVNKYYLALVRMSRKLSETGVTLVDKPIARHRTNRLRMAVSSSGRSSQTKIKVLAQACNLALVECEPLTGRTHQIRLHLSYLGAPIIGDVLYGGNSLWLDANKQPLTCPHPMLHAWKLSINHPKSHCRMNFMAPLPTDYKKLLVNLGITSTYVGDS